jgi:L-threonate 2-dehydrogenase
MAIANKTTQTSSKQITTVGMIGLGIMGSAMSANLVKTGFDVYGYDPVQKMCARLKKVGGHVCNSATEVAQNCNYIVLSLPSEAALDQVCKDLIASKRKGLVVAETSTLPESAKRRALDLLANHSITLIDCPLSGTGAQALTRDLAVYASGDAKAIKAFVPVFDGFARSLYEVGAFGNGIRMKLVANLLVAIHNISTAEAILMGVRSGLKAADVVRVVSDGSGSSRMMQIRGPTMANRTWSDAAMKVSLWQKDMRLINDALVATNTPAPLFSATMPIYNAAMALGHGMDDTAVVYAVLERLIGESASKAKPAKARKAK